jgi:hypothetical protein
MAATSAKFSPDGRAKPRVIEMHTVEELEKEHGDLHQFARE